MVADMNGLFEGQRVNTGGDDFFAAVSLGGHRRDHVDPRHDDAAEGRAVRVGLVRHDEVSCFDRAFTGTFRFWFCHLVLVLRFSVTGLESQVSLQDFRGRHNRRDR